MSLTEYLLTKYSFCGDDLHQYQHISGLELTFQSCPKKNSNDKNLLVLVSPECPPSLKLRGTTCEILHAVDC